MKSFFYIKERKKGSHTIKFSIYRIVKNEPIFLDLLKEDGRGYSGDYESVIRRLYELKEITKGEWKRHCWASPSFYLSQVHVC